MNFKDIIGPDELDWKVIPLDWKKIGKDELKLGTPMSKDGVEANDASCYGILMDDVEKGKHFQARVIVSGCVDFDKAEAYSGVKVSEEAKKAIGKVWSQAGGGPIDPKRLPEGYPYKENAEFVPETTVEVAEAERPTMVPFTFEITEGNLYKVIFDGVVYERVANYVNGTNIIGNAGIPGMGDDTGEPFLIINGDGMLVLFAKTAGTHKISVSGSIIHPIDVSYIPKLPMYKLQYSNGICMDIEVILGDWELVRTLSDGAIVHSVSPNVDFTELPVVGMRSGGNTCILQRESSGRYFVLYSAIVFGYTSDSDVVETRFNSYVFVHSDNVEQGIEEYKDRYGIE